MKIGITFSCFDLLHTGHILFLKAAADNCDKLIVGLQTDPTINRSEKNRPIQTYFERYIQIQGCKFVDDIIPYSHEEDIVNILSIFKPKVRFLGSDYYRKEFTGRQYCIDNNIEISYIDRDHNYSTSELRKRIKEGM